MIWPSSPITTAPTIGFGALFPRPSFEISLARRIADSAFIIIATPRIDFRGAQKSARKDARILFPLIRTLTVGLGVSPSPPLAGCKRVADFNCRFGITPTPETMKRV